MLFVLVTFNCIITDALLHYVESDYEFKKNLENVPYIKIKKDITVCFFFIVLLSLSDHKCVISLSPLKME